MIFTIININRPDGAAYSQSEVFAAAREVSAIVEKLTFYAANI